MSSRTFDVAGGLRFAEQFWDAKVVQTLLAYMTVQCVSPAYDQAWQEKGFISLAASMLQGWCLENQLPGMTVRINEIEGRTPVIVVEIPAYAGDGGDPLPPGSALLYGHFDKQPGMDKLWTEGRSPWEPKTEEHPDGLRIYGRGGADDGYSIFAALAMVRALRAQGVPHQRIVILIEASEESGSPDLPAHFAALEKEIGSPSLVVCLDSGCVDYERLCVTRTLRGLASGTLKVETLNHSVHSGVATGIGTDPLLAAMWLVSTITDLQTQRVHLDAIDESLSPDHLRQALDMATAMTGAGLLSKVPVLGKVSYADPEDRCSAIEFNTLRAGLTITGLDGLPPTRGAGNTMHPSVTLLLSLRLPPDTDPVPVMEELGRTFQNEAPHGAEVTFTPGHTARGWSSRPFPKWVSASLTASSLATFGNPALNVGEGGTIPLMRMLDEQFPDAVLVVTGLLGPGSNAHGPDEFLHVRTAWRLIACGAALLEDSAQNALGITP